jgi:acetyl coenzyme A synthetase (ADP forming)-like protein
MAHSIVHEADVILRDGSTLRVRPIEPGDEPRLFAFYRALSDRSRTLRFQGAMSEDSLRRMASELIKADGESTFGLVATAGHAERIVGHAMYARVRDERAEVAFAIADDYQGRGLGTLLLGQLAGIASENGLQSFEAQVLPENHQMLEVFRESGFAVRTRAGQGEIHIEFPTELTPGALERFEQRERSAAVNAVRAFFQPRSVAVIGASRRRGSLGAEVLHNVLSYGFQGPVLPINPNSAWIQSVVAYPDVEQVPGPVDLAVLVIPAERVLTVAESCARKGVRALVVISAGFKEAGPEGAARQNELVHICREAGVRLIGPNCMGIVNTDPDVRLNATFAPAPPPAGRVAFMSQSGALGLAIMDYAATLGLGLSTFASVGNKADISGNDLIRYWEQDPATDVILLYLESFGNPRKFSRIARRIARRKPIVAVKSGRSTAGARATGSHTGALVASSDVNVEALFRQAGVIRTDTLEEMFDVAMLLASQRPPKGRRVGIITNAGGPGILCADTCEAEGLEVPDLIDETKTALHALLPREATIGNPVDMIASASAPHYRDALRIVGRDPNIDAIVVIFVPPLVTRPEDAARAIVDGARDLVRDKPVLTVFMQARGVPEELRTADVRVPSYAFPEDAAIALARIVRYGEWLDRPVLPPPHFDDVRRDQAAAIVAAALGRGDGWLPPQDVRSLLECYGLPVLDERVVTDSAHVQAAAEQLGGKVVLKAIAPGVIHKTEAGAVRLDLSPDEAARAAPDMAERLRQQGHPPRAFLVQRMAPPGVEMIVGVVHDPSFGPVVACGAGGTLVELLKDVSVRLTPLSTRDAEEMVRELKTYPLLTGYRGAPPSDMAALIDVILRVAALVDDLPQIAELDLNPVRVHERGATVVDARVRIAPVESGAMIAAP